VQVRNVTNCSVCGLGGEVRVCGCNSLWHVHCVVDRSQAIREDNVVLLACPHCLKRYEYALPSAGVQNISHDERYTETNANYPIPRDNFRKRKHRDVMDLREPFASCYMLLQKIFELDHSALFREPIEYPDYYNHISHPMDLSTVEDNLLNDAYSSIDEFANDMNLIWNNAITYNSPTHIKKAANQLSNIFQRNFSELKKSLMATDKVYNRVNNSNPNLSHYYTAAPENSKMIHTGRAKQVGYISESKSDDNSDSIEGDRRAKQFIRVFYSDKTLKTDFINLEDLLCNRLYPHYPELKNSNFQIYYTDEDGEKIDIIDEECFSIFLLSTPSKDLYIKNLPK